MSARPATPPTTPPAIAPASLLEDELGAGVLDDEDELDDVEDVDEAEDVLELDVVEDEAAGELDWTSYVPLFSFTTKTPCPAAQQFVLSLPQQ